MGIILSVQNNIAHAFLANFTPCCFDKCFSPSHDEFRISIDMFSWIHGFRLIPLSLDCPFSLIHCLRVLKHVDYLLISRVLYYTSCVFRFRGRPPHLSCVTWDRVLRVVLCGSCLLLSPRVIEKGWAHCGLMNHDVFLKSGQFCFAL